MLSLYERPRKNAINYSVGTPAGSFDLSYLAESESHIVTMRPPLDVAFGLPLKSHFVKGLKEASLRHASADFAPS